MESEQYLNQERIPKSHHFQIMQRLAAEYSITSDIHPSRTLDQSYYENMEDTSKRDHDQVVYRYTKKRLNHLDEGQNIERVGMRVATSPLPENEEDASGETQGAEDVNSIKLLMVNQLWLWKLDDSALSLRP